MKRLALALAAVLLLAACGCGRQSGAEVAGTPVSAGVCRYFDDLARTQNPDASEEDRQAATDALLSEYVAVNSAFSARGLRLTSQQKAAVSQSVNDLWRLFGSYYTSLGVTKQELWKVETSEAYREALLLDYYAPDGDEPVTEATLQSYFGENYIAFQSITGFLVTADDSGNAVALDESARAALISSFERAAAAIAGGSSVAAEAAKLENTIANTETTVVSREDPNYSDAFFERVTATENGATAVFTDGDYVFLVLRENIADPERDLFSDYRTDCLETLKGEAFDRILQTWAQAYPVER